MHHRGTRRETRERRRGHPLYGGANDVVAIVATGVLQYREYEKTAAERALIDKLHAVTTRSILDVLHRYSSGDISRKGAEEWLSSAMVEPRRDGSFAEELLGAAEALLSRITISEACHKDVIQSLRTEELPAALGAIERIAPAVDTQKEFVRQYVRAIADPAQRNAAKTTRSTNGMTSWTAWEMPSARSSES